MENEELILVEAICSSIKKTYQIKIPDKSKYHVCTLIYMFGFSSVLCAVQYVKWMNPNEYYDFDSLIGAILFALKEDPNMSL